MTPFTIDAGPTAIDDDIDLQQVFPTFTHVQELVQRWHQLTTSLFIDGRSTDEKMTKEGRAFDAMLKAGEVALNAPGVEGPIRLEVAFAIAGILNATFGKNQATRYYLSRMRVSDADIQTVMDRRRSSMRAVTMPIRERTRETAVA